MKRSKSKSIRKPIESAQPSATAASEPARAHMVENGMRLVNQPGYPNNKIVNRLAEIFASSFIAERN